VGQDGSEGVCCYVVLKYAKFSERLQKYKECTLFLVGWEEDLEVFE
jgi:hypothetical protein